MKGNGNEDDQCIGNLEHHLHQLFSSVRVPGDDFGYSASQEMFSVLDAYCDDSTFHEPKAPLLFLDESGSGKSALLSNWLQKKHKKLAQGRKGDEFIFWHAVGCSRQSMNVNSLIRRLMHDLKSRFDLVRDVPMAQDRLSWELPRFFEMAAKRGRLIIVIDGIHRLVTNEDTEAGLAWLPLEFPANVRIILTATEQRAHFSLDASSTSNSINQNHGGGRDSAGIAEMKTLDFGDMPSMGDDEVEDMGSPAHKNLPKGSKILAELRRRKWRHIRVKRMDRSQCRNVVETYILKSVQKDTMDLTTGPFLTHLPDENKDEVVPLDVAPGYLLYDTQIAKLLTHPMGGTPMFLRLFMQCSQYAAKRGFSLWQIWDDWLNGDSVSALLLRILATFEQGHIPTSSTRKADRAQTEEAGALQTLRVMYPWHPSFQDDDFQDNLNQDSAEHVEVRVITKNISQEDEVDEGVTTLSAKVNENLGDQQWLALGGFAETVLKRTRLQIQDVLLSAMQHAQTMASMDMNSSQMLSAGTTKAPTKTSGIVSPSALSEADPIAGPLAILEASLKLASQMKLSTEHHSKSELKEAAVESIGKHENDSSDPADEKEGNADIKASEFPIIEEKHDNPIDSSMKYANKAAGIETLPLYFLGGAEVAGLGNILGNALSLLYVARHGLKESEMWGLLTSLLNQEKQIDMMRSKEGKFGQGGGYLGPDNGETQAIVQICYTARGMLEDLCRAEDLAHTGQITRGALTTVLHRLHPGLSFTDMIRLLEITSMLKEDPAKLSEDIYVDYLEILRRVAVVFEKRNKKGDSTVLSYEKLSISKDPREFNSKKNHRGKDENFAANLSIDASSVSENAAHVNSEALISLGPVLEESLLKVLIALGVLHSPENHVLVLPSDNDVLREVIYNRYVVARGGEAVWHGHLIRHFQKEPNTMRRCEELPWHLQLCRRWHAMKDTLVDLSTFEMMYDSSDLRDEFMSYWVQLTEGPMYLTNELHKIAMITQQKQVEEVLRGDRSRDPELAKILIQLDTAAALNLTEKNAKKLLLQNQVNAFDVIEEFNKSLEMWVAKARPSVMAINERVLHIARFLAEFSLKGAAQPPFLRLGIEMRALELFGIHFDSFKDVMAEEATEDPNKLLPLENGEAEVEIQQKKLIEYFPAPRHLKGGNIYYYLRWIWIQFPWLALNKTVEVGSVCEVGGLASVLAAYAAGARGRGRSGPPVAAIADRDEMVYDEDPDGAQSGSGSVSFAKGQKNLAIARSTRLWDVKKNDPSKPVFENTESRKQAFVKSILVPAKVQDVMNMNIRKVRDDIANASAAKHKMPPKFRRTMEQELEAMKGIPHSQHCQRSLSRNTLFPSLDAHIKEKNKEIEEDGELYANALATMRLGGPGLPLEAGLEADIKLLAEQEQMLAWNQRRGGALPVASERELEFEREFERMIRLRSLANKTTTLLRERIALRDSLRHEAESRDVQDEEIQQFMYSGEEAIKQLKEKYQTMSDALDEGKRLNNGYALLIEWLQLTPPFSEQHVLQQQSQVILAKQQLADVQRFRHDMYMQAEREALIKQKQIQTKIEYFREARNKTATKRAKLFPHLEPVNLGLVDDEQDDQSSVKGDAEKNGGGRHGRNAFVMSKDSVDAISIASAIEKGSTMAGMSAKDNSIEVADKIDGMATQQSARINESANLLASSVKKESVKERAKRLKKERDEMAKQHEQFHFDKESLQQSVLQAIFKSDEEKQREMESHAKVIQSTMMWEYVMEKTGSVHEDELIERFLQGKKLTDSLLAQQSLADSRLAQLRTEHDEVKQQLSQSILMGEGAAKEEEAAPAVDSLAKSSDQEEIFTENQNDARVIENRLFSTEMRLAQIQRQVEMSINKINEVRTGVGHIMNLLSVNARMLHNLPKSIPPKMKSGDDVAACIAWCEERILAINEAQMVDSSNTKGAGAASGNSGDDNKPFFTRQTDLAVAVQSMFDKANGGATRRVARKTKTKKTVGGMSAMLINPNDGGNNVNSPREVVVVSRTDVDTLNDLEVEKMQRMRDRHSENFEAQQLEAKIETSGAGVQKFLTEALGTKESQLLLRKTNLASNDRKGRNAGYGYVLDEFLEKAGLPNRLNGTESKPLSASIEESISKKKTKKVSPQKEEPITP